MSAAELLEAHPLLSRLTLEQIERIASAGELETFAAGEEIVREGSPGDALYLVLTGKVAVERNLDVVPRANHATTVLADGDRLELVTFVGGADAVMKVKTWFAASGFAAGSRTPVVAVTVYVASFASAAAGVKVTRSPTEVSVPATAPLGPVTVKFAATTVAPSSGSLKRTTMGRFVCTAVSPARGREVTTFGAVRSMTTGVAVARFDSALSPALFCAVTTYE